MNFQNIANLIEKKKFHEAKACLIELEKKNDRFDISLIS